MRSRSDAALTGRCRRCYLTTPHCVCAALPIVETRTRVLVVRHCLEALKSTNSARIAALCLPRLTLHPYGERARPFDAALLRPPVALLYPPTASEPAGEHGAADEPEATPLAPAPTLTPEALRAEPGELLLVVPDGNWTQTRRMARRLSQGRALPRLDLSAAAAGLGDARRLRRAEPGRLSTFEAIIEALAALEGPALRAPLEAARMHWMAAVLRSRGRDA